MKRNLTLTRMTDEQKALWDRDGYLIIPNALSSEELEALLAEVDRLDQESQRLGRNPDAPLDANNLIDAPVEGLFSSEPGKHQVLDPRPNDVFLSLLDHPAHLGLLCQIMGAAIHMAWSHLMIRPPSPAPANRWHQDGPKPYLFPRVDGQMACQWVRVGWYLTDLDQRDMGNLCIIPGSHRTGFPKLDKGLDHTLTITSFDRFKEVDRLDADVPDAKQITVKAGDAILLHNALYHCVVRNTSNVRRKNIYYVYTPIWQRLGDRDASSPQLISRCAPVRRQLLGALSGPHTNGGIHPFDEGVPLVRLFEGRSFAETWLQLDEDYIRRTQQATEKAEPEQ